MAGKRRKVGNKEGQSKDNWQAKELRGKGTRMVKVLKIRRLRKKAGRWTRKDKVL